MYNFRNLVALALFACLSVVTTGCNTDCDTYCRNQGNFIDGCLPQFDQAWADLGEGEWSKKSDFIGFCKDEIEAYILDDIEAACADAADEDRRDCENTIREGTVQVCGEHLNDFTLSCTDYWTNNNTFTPAPFVPMQPNGDDDDSAAGDDDDSAAGDDDDSAAGDDDDSTAGDDDDSAAGDDDDSAAGDDDDSAAGDDDDSAP